jgi:hypothetical protein
MLHPSRWVALRLIPMLTATVLIAGVLATFWLTRDSSLPSGDPAAAVADMLTAEREGELDVWLGSFGGDLHTQLARQVAAVPREQGVAELRRGTATLLGCVTHSVEQIASDRAVVVVERIYRDSNERQRLELQQLDGQWKIVAQTVNERFAPEIPYGTPVVQPAADH